LTGESFVFKGYDASNKVFNSGDNNAKVLQIDRYSGWAWHPCRDRDSRTHAVDVIRPGEFIMMRGMLLGIKERAETVNE
jgi:hypothetical protein